VVLKPLSNILIFPLFGHVDIIIRFDRCLALLHNASALVTVECAIELAGFGVALTEEYNCALVCSHLPLFFILRSCPVAYKALRSLKIRACKIHAFNYPTPIFERLLSATSRLPEFVIPL